MMTASYRPTLWNRLLAACFGCMRWFARCATWPVRSTEPLDDIRLAELPLAPVPHDLRRDLGRAIAALPPIYRDVLVLRDVEELTAPETAQRLGITVEAVKSRLHRARSMLREALVASGYWFGSA